ncbi:hypothetical protein B0H12DRAFT_1308147 [Mycena haematopus]|nr:hypothetical protein B0H12DRAFT_1308147 [Mycena haematopus]
MESQFHTWNLLEEPSQVRVIMINGVFGKSHSKRQWWLKGPKRSWPLKRQSFSPYHIRASLTLTITIEPVSGFKSTPRQQHSQLYPQQYSVTALHNYLADPEDPFEISFNKGDILDIVDQQGKWWWVIKDDGTVGLAPSNYLRNGLHKFSVTALDDYTANGADKNEISFTKGEVLSILDQQGQWWQVKKADGSVGFAPANYLRQNLSAEKRKSFSREINGLLGTFLWWQTKRADESTGHIADATDPNEISFHKHEVLDIAHTRGRWLVARKADGSTGIVPSTYLEVIPNPVYEPAGW